MTGKAAKRGTLDQPGYTFGFDGDTLDGTLQRERPEEVSLDVALGDGSEADHVQLVLVPH